MPISHICWEIPLLPQHLQCTAPKLITAYSSNSISHAQVVPLSPLSAAAYPTPCLQSWLTPPCAQPPSSTHHMVLMILPSECSLNLSTSLFSHSHHHTASSPPTWIPAVVSKLLLSLLPLQCPLGTTTELNFPAPIPNKSVPIQEHREAPKGLWLQSRSLQGPFATSALICFQLASPAFLLLHKASLLHSVLHAP